MRKLIALHIVCAIFTATGVAFAEEVDIVKLTNQWWGYCRDKNFEAFKDTLAPGFRGGNQHKAYDLEGFMRIAKNVNVGDFSLSDFKVTRKDDVIAVTYYGQVAETMGGKRIKTQKAPRVDVWIKTDKGWKVLSHANLNPLGK